MTKKVTEIKKENKSVMKLRYEGCEFDIESHFDIMYHKANLNAIKRMIMRLPSLHSIEKSLEDIEVARRLLEKRDAEKYC